LSAALDLFVLALAYGPCDVIVSAFGATSLVGAA
jgi:hypothetical protein